MMGERTVMQEALFYSFRIEDHVPQDHLPGDLLIFAGVGKALTAIAPDVLTLAVLASAGVVG